MSMMQDALVANLRWVMLMSLIAWSASGVAQEAANRTEPPSPEPR